MECDVKRETQQQVYNKEIFKTQQFELDHNLQKENKREDAQLTSMENKLIVKEKGYTPNVLKAMVLETTKDIYTHL